MEIISKNNHGCFINKYFFGMKNMDRKGREKSYSGYSFANECRKKNNVKASSSADIKLPITCISFSI